MRLLAALAIVATLVAGTALPAAAQKIKMGTLAPEGSPWHNAARDLAEAWREISNGEIDMVIYAGGVAGDDAGMVRKLRIGQLHAAALTGEGLGQITESVRVFQIPMMLRTNEELDYVRERLSQTLEAEFEAKGFKLLLWADVGWVYFFSSAPVVTPDDLRAYKMFTWAEGGGLEAWREMGVDVVPLNVTDILTALQSSMIEALPTTPVAALSHQWFGLASHMTEMPIAPLVGGMVISLKTWNKLPEDIRPELLRATHEIGARLQSEIREFESKAIAAMIERGLIVHPVPPDMVDQWERVARSAYPKFIGPVAPADVAAELERVRDEYRANLGG